MEHRCVLVQNVGQDSEQELRSIPEENGLSPEWIHFGEQCIYILFEEEDDATKALKKLHVKTISGKSV